MAGHHLTPYDLTATRARARKNKDQKLLLASLSDKTTIDLLDLISANIRTVAPVQSADGSRTVRCVAATRNDDVVRMVFAADLVGEREVVHDGDDDERPAVFEKRKTHITRYFSVATLWRPSDGETGILLVHSPWGRGGSKGQILTLLQRSVSIDPLARAKLHADPKIPGAVLRRILDTAQSTKITYLRHTGVTSEFDAAVGQKSAAAEMALVIKGSDSLPFRDALTAALRTGKSREKFFTIQVRDDDTGDLRTETFDDVEVDVRTGGGVKTYSLRKDTFPTLGFDYTPEINAVYWALPSDEYEKWPMGLLDGTSGVFDRLLAEVRAT